MGAALSIILIVIIGGIAYGAYIAYKKFSNPVDLAKDIAGGAVEVVKEVGEEVVKVVKDVIPGIEGDENCKKKFGQTAFWDAINGGQCYECAQGFERTVGLDSVASGKACVRKGGNCPNVTKTPGDGGQFKDVTKDECWSCGKGKVRTIGLDAVDSAKACVGVGGKCPTPISKAVMIKHNGSNKCLYVDSNDSNKIKFANCNANDLSQNWEYIRNTPGKTLIKNKKNGQCLDAGHKDKDRYTGPCNANNSYQQWEERGKGNLKNRKHNTCLDGNGSKLYWGGCDSNNRYKQFQETEVTKKLGWHGAVADVCYSCPDGYDKSGPADFANKNRQCVRKGGNCPGPNGFKRGDQCFKCPPGYVGSTHDDWKNKGCIAGDITGKCPSGQFKVEHRCYSCPSTHKQSGPLDFMHKDKQCIKKDEKCPHVAGVGWQGQVAGRCYSCPKGYDKTLPHLFGQGKHCIMKSLGTDGQTDNLGLGREIGKTWYSKMIRHQKSGKCLDAGGSNGQVKFHKCMPGNNWQKWDFIGPLGGKNIIKNKQNNKCIDANSPNKPLKTNNCDKNNVYQQFQDIGSGLLKNTQRNKCLDGNGDKFYWGGCGNPNNQYQQFYAENVGWSDFDLSRKWSCPDGYKRTIFPVDGDAACERKRYGGDGYRNDQLRIGGKSLNHPSKSISEIHVPNLHKDGAQGWSGVDAVGRSSDGSGPYMWHCPPGYGRQIHHIQTDKACGRGGKYARATYMGRLFRKADNRGPADPIKGVDHGSLYTQAKDHGTVFKKANDISNVFREGTNHGSVFSKARNHGSVFAKAIHKGNPTLEEKYRVNVDVLRGNTDEFFRLRG